MNEINYSVAGFGYMGRLHTIAARSMPLCYDDFPFRIVFDKLITSRELNTEYTGYKTHVKTLENLQTEVIDICTPNFMHREQIEKAIAHGIRNIYCEKPLTGIYEEEKLLVELASAKEVKNQVGLVLRFLPAAVRAKRMLQDGVIGEMINFNCHMYHQSYLNPDRPISWRLQKEKSRGGALMDLGIHLIDLAQYLLGPIKKVRSITKTMIKERRSDTGISPVDVDDFARLDLVIDKDICGVLEVSRMAAGRDEDTVFEIFGTKGSIKIDIKNPEWPEVCLWRENTRKQGGFVTYKEVEAELKKIWPSGKFSLGWMVNCHMASLYSFLLKIHGQRFQYIDLPDFEDAASACKILNVAYKSAKILQEKIIH